ncbi:hypothetical protein MHU86_12337 [Fragilaria crotonensis]|nr:hypothetical protein MHU86_12337 [Fragilaria crotonensis]
MSRGEFLSDEGTVARCEMDSHADTCVAGPNFMVLAFTGEQCDVTPYMSDYQPIINVAVVNAVTACTDESTAETVILYFNEVLWYGKRMKMSLINPNQLRHFGIAVSDDPTDNTRPFGISTDELHIPFHMDGTTVYFETRVPTTWISTFYDCVWHWDQVKTDMTNEQARIGRWLGIAHRVGSDMTYWILTESGRVIARSTVHHITFSDLVTNATRARVSTFDDTLLTRLSDTDFHIEHPYPVFYVQDDDLPADVDPADAHIPADAEYGDMYQPAKLDADDVEFDSFDQYLSSEFLVNQNGEPTTAKVIKRARDNDGNPIGKRNLNPLLDTHVCTSAS